ncbi:MAG TPA: hypothetical protein VIQ80_03090 [Candidatus Saccharimonadales bacterium]
MKFFATPTPAPKPKTNAVRQISLGLVAFFILIAVAQLFTFEKYPAVIADMWLWGGAEFALVWAAVIVTLEVAAVPFLLSMRLSPAMRVVSMAAGWLVTFLWVGILFWQNSERAVIANNGLLGATLKVPTGWWSVLLWFALGILLAWVAWGMWPIKTSRK